MLTIATTKIWAIKDSLKRVVEYASNPEKTEIDDDLYVTLHYAVKPEKVNRLDERKCFVTGVACSAETAYEEMMQVKENFGKTGGNVAYHAYQSFKPGEVNPEQCHEIGVALARKLWGANYQVVVATHLDKEHCHNHFVINSVSYTSGRKFDCSEKTYYQFRDASDALCAERGLSVIKNPKGHTPRSLYFAEKRGEPTKYNLMRDALDKAIAMSYTETQFHKALQKMGYVIERTEGYKYPTIRSVNSKKAARLYHLGEEYTPEIIRERILMNPPSVNLYWNSFMFPDKGSAPKSNYDPIENLLRGCNGITAWIVLFCVLLGLLPNEVPPSQRHKPLSPELKEAARRNERYARQVYLSAREQFTDVDSVEAFKVRTQEQIDALSKERRKIYDKVTRAKTEEEKQSYRPEELVLTERISRLRKDLATANTIIQDIPYYIHCIEAEKNMETLQKEIESPQKNRGKNR